MASPTSNTVKSDGGRIQDTDRPLVRSQSATSSKLTQPMLPTHTHSKRSKKSQTMCPAPQPMQKRQAPPSTDYKQHEEDKSLPAEVPATAVCSWSQLIDTLAIRPTVAVHTPESALNESLTSMELDESHDTQTHQSEAEVELHMFGERRYLQIRGYSHPMRVGEFFFNIMGCFAALFPNSAHNDLTVRIGFVMTRIGRGINEALATGHIWVLGRNAVHISSERDLEQCVLIPTSPSAPRAVQSSIDVSPFVPQDCVESIRWKSKRLSSLPPNPSPTTTSVFAYMQAADYRNAVLALQEC